MRVTGHFRFQPSALSLPALVLAAGMLLGGPVVWGAEQRFAVGGVEMVLEEVTAEAQVFFQSMRLNRAAGEWNAEMVVVNRSGRVLPGPLVVLVTGASGTSGPLGADGLDTEVPGRPYYDLTGWLEEGALPAGARTAPRTIALGVAWGAPKLETRVYARPERSGVALASVRTLNAAGQPLPGVALSIVGPEGVEERVSDPDAGVASVGQGPGEHVIRFSAEGYLPVWRQRLLVAGETRVVPSPRLTPRASEIFTVTPLGGTVVRDVAGRVEISFGPGTVNQATTVRLTPLTRRVLVRRRLK